MGRLRDRLIMATPSEWITWPVLALKRIGDNFEGTPELGYIYDRATTDEVDPRVEAKVYLGNMWAPTTDDTPTLTYESFSELLDDGWRID